MADGDGDTAGDVASTTHQGRICHDVTRPAHYYTETMGLSDLDNAECPLIMLCHYAAHRLMIKTKPLPIHQIHHHGYTTQARKRPPAAALTKWCFYPGSAPRLNN